MLKKKKSLERFLSSGFLSASFLNPNVIEVHFLGRHISWSTWHVAPSLNALGEGDHIPYALSSTHLGDESVEACGQEMRWVVNTSIYLMLVILITNNYWLLKGISAYMNLQSSIWITVLVLICYQFSFQYCKLWILSWIPAIVIHTLYLFWLLWKFWSQ